MAHINFIAVHSSICTAFGAIDIETCHDTSLLADTRLYARLSLRDTRLLVYITASVIVLSPICMVFVPGVLFLLKQKLTR